ncbi:MAG TPA: T9SS type A sorting domain-containing protein [Flavobacteriaceae bacterium]
MKKITSENLSKRLTQYGALTTALTGVANVNGQIYYSGIIDDTAYNDTYSLDLDGDTNTDFVFEHFYYSKSYGNLLSVNVNFAFNPQNAILGSFDLYIYPFALNDGDPIASGDTNWINNSNIGFLNRYSYCYNSKTAWCSSVSKSTNKYMGLRFEFNGEIHYGWARLEIGVVPSDWVLKDFAYNTTAGEAIEAGQQTLGIQNNVFANVKIVALNKSIALYNLPEQLNYSVLEMSGKVALKGITSNNMDTIEASTLSSGVYIIELKNQSNAVIRKKVVLQ